jgi:NADPH:quinone reductase-like Zn-dependent oxidoreductase
MKAVVYYEQGGPEKLVYEDRREPVVREGEALIKVEACALNRLDILTRSGVVKTTARLPHILGCDIVGYVEKQKGGDLPTGSPVLIYPNVTCGRCVHCLSGRENRCNSLKLIGVHTDGGYAEYVNAPIKNLIPLTPKIPLEEYAAIPIDYTTVWQALLERGELRAGESILIWAGGSGAGTVATRLAKIIGATVFTTVGSDEKAKKAKPLADYVFNHYTDDVPSLVKEYTGGRGVDVVLDYVGTSTWKRSLECLTVGGRLVTFGGLSGYSGEIDIRAFYTRHLTLIGTYGGTRLDLLKALGFAERGLLRPIIDSIYRLKDALEAHVRMEENRHFGKILLKP